MSKRIGILLSLLVLLLAACSQVNVPQTPTQLETLAKKEKKKIVEEPTTEPVSECTALYSSEGAQATLSNAVIDPSLDYGSVGTLILSFNFDDALAPAADFISNTLGTEVGEGLGVFEHLPMLALYAPITRELIATLQTNLQGYGLLSIYQDRPLQYFLDESVAFIKADAARETFDVTGKGVGVGVIDSGIDGTQGDFPTLVKNVKIVGSIFSSGVSGALYVDTPNSDLTSGHGTHVAGTIAGSGAMSGGKYLGVAPGADLIGVGAGHAKDTTSATSPLIRKGKPGELADFSSRGVPGDAYHHPDIVLPGVNIVAARATSGAIVPPYTGYHGDTLEPSYSSISGTSMATPHMSGLTALILEVNPELDLDGVLEAVTGTANPMYVMSDDGTTRQYELHEVGAGYADAYAAVQAAASTAGTRTTTTTALLDTWTGTVGLALQEAGVDSEHSYTLSVPSGASALQVETDWGNAAYDLDLYVYDPSGNLIASSAVFATPSEAVVIQSPVAGDYRVQLRGWLNGPTPYTGTAKIDTVTAF